MKEAVLSLRDGDSEHKVVVKLTEDQLIIKDFVPENSSPALKLENPASPTSPITPTFSRQTTASVSSSESSARSASARSQHLDQSSPQVDQNNSSKMPAGNDIPNERVVTIKRQPGGGLGISVKGGAEHGIPVLISRVFPGQAADQTHLLHPGDAILAVNGKRVEQMLHDDVVSELRLCGAEVALTVRAFDGASHVLRTSVSSATAPNSSAISSDQPNTPTNNFEHSTEGAHAEPAHAKTSPRHDPNMSTHIGAHNNPNMSTHLDSSIYEEKMKTISLANARLECFVPGSDQLRSDCFEVYPLEGESTGLIVCPNKTELNNWIREVSTAIHRATMKQTTNQPPHAGTITIQGWLYERTPTTRGVEGAWSPRFVAVRDGQIYIFDNPPESPLDWEQCSRVFTLYESLCKSHLKPKQLLDKREHCFSIQHSTKPPVYCSGQSKDEVALWEDRIQKATHEAVYALQTKSYKCRFESRDCMFTIHFNNGFKLMDTITEEVIWEYKFSQLKGSSDDGKSLITFTFHNRNTGQLDKQSFTCDRSFPLLFCVHAFLAAKLSLVDPDFLKHTAHAQTTSHTTTTTLTNGTLG